MGSESGRSTKAAERDDRILVLQRRWNRIDGLAAAGPDFLTVGRIVCLDTVRTVFTTTRVAIHP